MGVEFLDPADPVSAGFRDAVKAELTAFLAGQTEPVSAMGAELAPVLAMAGRLLGGGKRLRPAFCVWGYVAAAGLDTDLAPVLRAASSLELLHVSALVHDDVMDASDVRRGRPAAHRQFETQHVEAGRLGDPAAFGRAGAILLGDLLLMWSVEMLQRAGLPVAALLAGSPIVQAMRTEVTCGQYLDVVAQARPLPTGSATDTAALQRALAEAGQVVEFKSARYTVQRPCQLGAAIGGAPPAVQQALAAYGSPLGRAFQFRDDLLGVFGDPEVTGKPAGDDLREGKRTVLVAHAYAHADRSGRELIATRLGDPALDAAGVAELQRVIIGTGAREAVEQMITDGHRAAVAALDQAEVTEDGRTALQRLASAAVHRAF